MVTLEATHLLDVQRGDVFSWNRITEFITNRDGERAGLIHHASHRIGSHDEVDTRAYGPGGLLTCLG